MQRNECWPDRITRFIAGMMLLGLSGALAALVGFRTCKRQEGAHP
jgi:hypothetical protein